MPYFIYKISEMPILQMEKMEQHEAYRDAAARAKQLRSELESGPSSMIKVIFAETELHAEDLLSQVRAPIPNPQDD